MTESIIEIRELSRTFGAKKALDNVSLRVPTGSVFGLVGENGAGKTTTIKILMGLHFQTSGTATIMGRPLGDNKVKAKIGFLPENSHFYDYLTGNEFLEFYAQLYGMPGDLRRKRIPELLKMVGLGHAGHIPLRGYSKGMQQRAGLAQALLNDPKLVILDEPQSGLDPFGRKEVRDIILRLKEDGKTVMFSSHILGDAEAICDRVAILHKGELIALGEMNELLGTAISEYEVRFAEPSADLLTFVEVKAPKVQKGSRDYIAIFNEESVAEEVIKRLLGGEGKFISYTPRRENLENYFIRNIEEKQAAEVKSS